VQYYLSTEGTLPPWLPPLPSVVTSTSTSHNPSISSLGSSDSSGYRGGSKAVSLQDIYDSAGPNPSSTNQIRPGRNYDLYGTDEALAPRPSIAGDRLRSKLRPSNTRSSGRPTSEDQGGRSGGYTGRSGFGGGDDHDPYSYQESNYDSGRAREQRQGQGQYSGGLPSRPSARR
jgi:hypothetical protein